MMDPLHFQFNTFIGLLRRAVEQLYGIVMSIPFLTPLPES